jgi:hypothetical protein
MATLEDLRHELNTIIRDYDLFNEVVDRMWKSSALATILGKNKRKVTGGISYEFRVRLTETDIPTQRKRFYDVIETSRVGNPVVGKFQLGIMQKAISISKDELEANKGEAKIIDLVTDRMKEFEESVKKQFLLDLIYGDPAVEPNAPTGLETILTPNNNYAGINESTYPSWNPLVLDASDNTQTQYTVDSDTKLLSTYGTTDVRTIDLFINDVVYKISKGQPDLRPNLVLTTGHIYSLIKASIFPQVLLQDKSLVDVGFDNVKFNGLTIVDDPFIPDQTMYFLSTDDIMILYKSLDMNPPEFKVEDPSGKARTLISIVEIEWTLACIRRRTQAKVIKVGSPTTT